MDFDLNYVVGRDAHGCALLKEDAQTCCGCVPEDAGI
jgi:hypothetical protein